MSNLAPVRSKVHNLWQARNKKISFLRSDKQANILFRVFMVFAQLLAEEENWKQSNTIDNRYRVRLVPKDISFSSLPFLRFYFRFNHFYTLSSNIHTHTHSHITHTHTHHTHTHTHTLLPMPSTIFWNEQILAFFFVFFSSFILSEMTFILKFAFFSSFSSFYRFIGKPLILFM